MERYRIYWKRKTRTIWYGKRKEIEGKWLHLAYVTLNGRHYSTYQKYRYDYPCERYSDMLADYQPRKKLTGVQETVLRDIDNAARRWWNKKNPKKKCK